MSRAGFILAEVSIAYLVLALTVAALVPSLIVVMKANKRTEKMQVAMELAGELMEEVRLRKWDENSTIPAAYTDTISTTLGADTGETATDKSTFDDVDDFNGWTESGARDPLNNALSAYTAYRRAVTVSFVDSSLAASASSTDYKRVAVCVTPTGMTAVCLTTVLTNR